MTKSMIERINTVSNAVEAVLGCPATNDQVVATIKAIESFTSPVNTTEQAIHTAIATLKKPQAKASKPKPKKVKRTVEYTDWSRYEAWFDTMLDGQPHVVWYSDMKTTVPESIKIRRSSWRNKLRSAAIARGYKSASVQYDDHMQAIRIEAIK